MNLEECIEVFNHHLNPSSSWHKDVNDLKSFVRVFVFLNDVVDENDGPMQYVLKSHSNNLKSFLPLKNYKNILEDWKIFIKRNFEIL